MICIIDYRAGNMTSIRNMLRRLGHESTISSDPKIVESADKLILPGVGAFDHGMDQLNSLGLVPILRESVLEKKTPILGICLGAQLLTRGSEEGSLPGLAWLDAETVAFDRSRLNERLRVPHMGWEVVDLKKESLLFTDMPEDPRFYFVHSYHMVNDRTDDLLLTASHGYPFAAALERGHIAGVQFHPEKSHRFGMCLLENFVTRFGS